MLSLGLDTSGPACDVAVLQDERCLAARREDMQRGQDARLAGLVSETCAAAGIALGQLDRIGIVTGPGSFTGIRVGLAFARGLALATPADCVGVTSLEAALPAGTQGSAIVILPAQRRPPGITYWAQRFRSGAATGAAEEIALGDLADELRAHPRRVYGDGQALADALGDLVITPAAPSAERAGRLAQRFDPALHLPRPNYARAPDAALPGGAGP
ncbi:MAG: tRNA (adenosine(37)-N6)-threonylcarbamoyltransferase complex dimerization subunit type 1 TsaB [Pseudomonadota bacterium]